MENIDQTPSPSIYNEECAEIMQAEHSGPEEIAPAVSNETIDLDVARCLRCVVERHPDSYTNIIIAGVAVGQCLEMSPQRAVASLKRISYADQPPIARPRRTLPFRLTAEASQLSAAPAPNTCQKIGSETIHTKPAAPRQRLTAQEKVVQECIKNISDTEDQARAAKEIQSLIDRKMLVVKRTRVTNMPTVSGYPDRGSWVHLGIGKALASQTESIQKAILYHLGVDHLIYGERLDPEALREELCLLPLDELSAIASLMLYQIDRKSVARLATKKR